MFDIPALSLLLSVILDLWLVKKPVLESSLIHLALLLLLPAWVANQPSCQLARFHPLLTSRIHFGLLAAVLACLQLWWLV